MRIWEIRADERLMNRHIMPKETTYTYQFRFIYFDNAILTMYVRRISYRKRSRRWKQFVTELTLNHFLTSFFRDNEDYINRFC